MMDVEDMEKAGILGFRLSLGKLLVSKAYDITMIIIIVIYSLLIVAFFILEDIYFTPFMKLEDDGSWHDPVLGPKAQYH